MAHIAKLNSKNIVTQVLSAPDNIDENEISERTGEKWKQTSYNTFANTHKLGNTPYRKNYAGIGFKYYVSHDGFAPPKPYSSWTLNTTTLQWDAPVEKPNDGNIYMWDEDSTQWSIVS